MGHSPRLPTIVAIGNLFRNATALQKDSLQTAENRHSMGVGLTTPW